MDVMVPFHYTISATLYTDGHNHRISGKADDGSHLDAMVTDALLRGAKMDEIRIEIVRGSTSGWTQ